MKMFSRMAAAIKAASKAHGKARAAKVQATEKKASSFSDPQTRASRGVKERELKSGPRKAAEKDSRRQKAEANQARRQGRKSREVGSSYKEPAWRSKEKKKVGKVGKVGYMSKISDAAKKRWGKKSDKPEEKKPLPSQASDKAREARPRRSGLGDNKRKTAAERRRRGLGLSRR